MSRPCDGPPAWSPVWRTAPARFQRAGALENAAEPDRPSRSEELLPARILRVRGEGPTTNNFPPPTGEPLTSSSTEQPEQPVL